MDNGTPGGPLIRAMAPSDLERIVAIDLAVLGKQRPDYWETKLSRAADQPPLHNLVAESDGLVVGFIIGGVSTWEYGLPRTVGWIDTIGVDPDHQRRGVARALFQAMSRDLKQAGVVTINTFVKSRDWKLLKYFQDMGFQKGDMVNLEVDI